MKKFATSCALCALLAAAKAADVSLPYGNAGLDYMSDKINSADSDLQEQTGVSFFFNYYSVLVSNPYGGAAQGTNYTGEMLFGLDFDLEKQIGWKGGGFYNFRGVQYGGKPLRQNRQFFYCVGIVRHKWGGFL